MFILFLRKRESASRAGAEGEGDTESEVGYSLWAVSTQPDTGLKFTNREIMTWAKVGRSTDWATPGLHVCYTFNIRSVHIKFSINVLFIIIVIHLISALLIFSTSHRFFYQRTDSPSLPFTLEVDGQRDFSARFLFIYLFIYLFFNCFF